MLECNDFDLLNAEETFTHFPFNQNRPSILDLTFASFDIFPSVSGWAVDDEASTGSDHSVIRFEILGSNTQFTPDPRSHRFNWKKANWKEFSSQLSSLANSQATEWAAALTSPTPPNLDKAAQMLRDAILTALTSTVPLSRPSPRSKAWWTDELTADRLAMVRAERKWKAKRTRATRERYRQLRNAYGHSIVAAKRNCFDNFLANAQGKDVFTALRFTRPKRVLRTPTMVANTGNANSFAEKAALFRQTLFPPLPDYTARNSTAPPPSLPWTPITDDEIRSAIFSSCPQKHLGLILSALAAFAMPTS